MKLNLVNIANRKSNGGLQFNFNTGQVLMALSVVILLITVALPMMMIFYNTFFNKVAFNWRMFVDVVFKYENVQAMWNTVKIAFIVTVIGTIIGVCFAWLVGRSDMPFKELMKTLFIIPYMFPPFLGALAWGLLFSPRSGYLNKLFMSLTGGSEPLFNIDGIPGIAFVEICYYFPFVFMQVASALENGSNP